VAQADCCTRHSSRIPTHDTLTGRLPGLLGAKPSGCLAAWPPDVLFKGLTSPETYKTQVRLSCGYLHGSCCPQIPKPILWIMRLLYHEGLVCRTRPRPIPTRSPSDWGATTKDNTRFNRWLTRRPAPPRCAAPAPALQKVALSSRSCALFHAHTLA